MNLFLLINSTSILALGSSLLADKGKNKLNKHLKIVMLGLIILNTMYLFAYGAGYIVGYLSK